MSNSITAPRRKRCPEYVSWSAMIQRCTNPKNKDYPRYGERGILIDPDWRNFKNFLADLGTRPSLTHTLERRDNNAGYNKENVYWADKRTQVLNRSNTINYTINGVTKCQADWCAQYNITSTSVKKRLAKGWDIVAAFTTPAKQNARTHTRGGRTQNIKEWAAELKVVPYGTVCSRLQLGWDIERALTTPALTEWDRHPKA